MTSRPRPDVGLEAALGTLCLGTLGAAGVGYASGEVVEGPVLCPLRLATGVPCPFCGMTRSLFAAGQGMWGASLDHNVLGPLVLVVAVVVLPLCLNAIVRRKRLAWPRFVFGAAGLVLAAGWALNLGQGVP